MVLSAGGTGANQGISRVAVVHLTLIVGMAGIALTDAPEALFGVFVVLKTLRRSVGCCRNGNRQLLRCG